MRLSTLAVAMELTPLQAMVDGHSVQAIGKIGIDTKHYFHAELHFVFAMAIQVAEDASSETWAFFARDRGDEGGCSSQLHVLGPVIRLLLFANDQNLVKTLMKVGRRS